MTRDEKYRKETKLVFPEFEVNEIDRWIRLAPICFQKHFPNRWVNSIYFDTESLLSFQANIDGISSREKVRYRWYGPNQVLGSGALEIKKRKNGLGWKSRIPISSGLGESGDSWQSIIERLRDNLTDEFKMYLEAYPCPILVNRYDRAYFLSRSGKIRLTVDKSQIVFNQSGRLIPNLSVSSYVMPSIIVELKYSQADTEEALRALQTLAGRVSRNSKYVTGVRAINSL